MRCNDCGQVHHTGLDGLRCEYQLGGRARLESRLTRLCVADVDAVVAEVERREVGQT